MYGYILDFHIVPPDFDIPYDGILGGNFFNIAGVRLDYAQRSMCIDNRIIPFHRYLDKLNVYLNTDGKV